MLIDLSDEDWEMEGYMNMVHLGFGILVKVFLWFEQARIYNCC